MTDAKHDKKMAAAQLQEARHAREAAKHDKIAAQAERETAQAQKGEARVKQPDDFAIL